MLRVVPLAVLALLLIPIVAGSVAILLSAFGMAPGLAMANPGLDAFAQAFSTPGFWTSARISLLTGLGASLISFLVVILFTAAFAHTRVLQAISVAIRPVLAVPHTAAAFGLAFLIAPSGFLVRLISPEFTGFARPPDWLIVADPAGWTMMMGLVIKEIPFLMFVTLAALPQSDPRNALVGSSIGHGRVWSWLVGVFPAIYRQIRLPLFAVIAFATSTVDVALVLGPVTPPPLAVRILHWFNDPNLNMRLTAAAAAVLQFGITFLALAIWWTGERLISYWGRWMALSGRRLRRDTALRSAAMATMTLAIAAVLAGIAVIALWSFAGPWRFPEALPFGFTFAGWMEESANLADTGLRALIVAVASSGAALVLVLACLENEYRADIRVTHRAWLMIYLPLLLPQIAFLGGLAALMVYLGIDGTLWAVILVHMVFVFPYVYLTLSDPWNSFDTRYLAVARTFGKGLNTVFFTVRVPMLLAPILAAFALGFAVSVAQYLPTLLIGAGRQPTLTTEAVALAAGGNRRLIGIYALVQTLMPFALFALAALIPMILWRNRRGLHAGGAEL